ncbi:autotransporter outer membrane beta-barrel domain-containing protein [Oceanibium sediminis]|uniref:autotransporter outer membrane beta-barrel domain-containing protein n=1 Tax=Oceanibium sediminis TaxID=2026339 RepID=UPI000DD4976F|nr:autotransporter outer membrane beta-barrel domain-containing protein [Oceanibium sediminis]
MFRKLASVFESILSAAQITRRMSFVVATLPPLLFAGSIVASGAVQAQGIGGTSSGSLEDQRAWPIECYSEWVRVDDYKKARDTIPIRNDCGSEAAGFDLVAEYGRLSFENYRIANITTGDGRRIPFEDPDTGNFWESVCPEFDKQARPDPNFVRPGSQSLTCEIFAQFRADGADGEERYYVLTGKIRTTFISQYAVQYSAYGSVIEIDATVSGPPDLTALNVRRFMRQRADTLLSSQPDLTGLLRGDRQSHSRLDYANGVGSLDLSVAAGGSFWADLTAAWSTRDGSDLSYSFGALGAHMALGDRTLLGLMLQLDHARLDDLYADIEGQGWLAGPYIVYRPPQTSLFFEGRLLYGGSENDVRMDGTGDASFETERWLAKVKVSGEVQKGRTTWMPYLEAAYTEDYQDGFVSTLGNNVPAQTISTAEMTLGLTFEHDLDERNAITGEVDWIGSRERVVSREELLNQDILAHRGRLSAGWIHRNPAGYSIELSGYLDGIGRSDYEAKGASVQFGYRF